MSTKFTPMAVWRMRACSGPGSPMATCSRRITSGPPVSCIRIASAISLSCGSLPYAVPLKPILKTSMVRNGLLELRYHHDMSFQRVFSNAPWETQVGYCRAVRAGSHVYVTGTAPVAEGGGVHAPGDATAQALRCFEITRGAL